MLYAKNKLKPYCVALGEQQTLCQRFVVQSLWLEVQWGWSDDLLTLVNKIEKTFTPSSAEKK